MLKEEICSQKLIQTSNNNQPHKPISVSPLKWQNPVASSDEESFELSSSLDSSLRDKSDSEIICGTPEENNDKYLSDEDIFHTKSINHTFNSHHYMNKNYEHLSYKSGEIENNSKGFTQLPQNNIVGNSDHSSTNSSLRVKTVPETEQEAVKTSYEHLSYKSGEIETNSKGFTQLPQNNIVGNSDHSSTNSLRVKTVPETEQEAVKTNYQYMDHNISCYPRSSPSLLISESCSNADFCEQKLDKLNENKPANNNISAFNIKNKTSNCKVPENHVENNFPESYHYIKKVSSSVDCYEEELPFKYIVKLPERNKLNGSMKPEFISSNVNFQEASTSYPKNKYTKFDISPEKNKIVLKHFKSGKSPALNSANIPKEKSLRLQHFYNEKGNVKDDRSTCTSASKLEVSKPPVFYIDANKLNSSHSFAYLKENSSNLSSLSSNISTSLLKAEEDINKSNETILDQKFGSSEDNSKICSGVLDNPYKVGHITYKLKYNNLDKFEVPKTTCAASNSASSLCSRHEISSMQNTSSNSNITDMSKNQTVMKCLEKLPICGNSTSSNKSENEIPHIKSYGFKTSKNCSVYVAQKSASDANQNLELGIIDLSSDNSEELYVENSSKITNDKILSNSHCNIKPKSSLPLGTSSEIINSSKSKESLSYVKNKSANHLNKFRSNIETSMKVFKGTANNSIKADMFDPSNSLDESINSFKPSTLFREKISATAESNYKVDKSNLENIPQNTTTSNLEIYNTSWEIKSVNKSSSSSVVVEEIVSSDLDDSPSLIAPAVQVSKMTNSESYSQNFGFLSHKKRRIEDGKNYVLKQAENCVELTNNTVCENYVLSNSDSTPEDLVEIDILPSKNSLSVSREIPVIVIDDD